MTLECTHYTLLCLRCECVFGMFDSHNVILPLLSCLSECVQFASYLNKLTLNVIVSNH